MSRSFPSPPPHFCTRTLLKIPTNETLCFAVKFVICSKIIKFFFAARHANFFHFAARRAFLELAFPQIGAAMQESRKRGNFAQTHAWANLAEVERYLRAKFKKIIIKRGISAYSVIACLLPIFAIRQLRGRLSSYEL